MDKPLQVTTTSGGLITNIYDAAGRLLTKTVGDPVAGTSNAYRYSGPFTYLDNKLQYILNGEGRGRWDPDSNLVHYDYFVKDHLGNVRNILTADAYPALNYWASYEISHSQTEIATFNNVSNIAVDKPGIDICDVGDGDVKSAILDGSDPDKRTGTSIMLHVMAGDKFELSAQSYWYTEDPLSIHALGGDMISSLMGALIGGSGGASAGEASAPTVMGNMLTNMPSYVDYLANMSEYAPVAGVPHAFLNYLVFDESMNLIESQSAAIQVGATPSQWNLIGTVNPVSIQQNGYVVAYINNAEYTPVYFDHFNINLYKGKLLQEQNYYPYGLSVNEGQGSELPDKFLYQGKEFQDQLGYDLYDFHARQYDAQIGRFASIDPMGQFPSGYIGMGADPANGTDPSGMQTKLNGSPTDTKHQEQHLGNDPNAWLLTLPHNAVVMSGDGTEEQVEEFPAQGNFQLPTLVFSGDGSGFTSEQIASFAGSGYNIVNSDGQAANYKYMGSTTVVNYNGQLYTQSDFSSQFPQYNSGSYDPNVNFTSASIYNSIPSSGGDGGNGTGNGWLDAMINTLTNWWSRGDNSGGNYRGSQPAGYSLLDKNSGSSGGNLRLAPLALHNYGFLDITQIVKASVGVGLERGDNVLENTAAIHDASDIALGGEENQDIAPIHVNPDGGASMWYKDGTTGHQYNRQASDIHWDNYLDSLKKARGY